MRYTKIVGPIGGCWLLGASLMLGFVGPIGAAWQTADPSEQPAETKTDWRQEVQRAIGQQEYARAFRLVRDQVGPDAVDPSDLLLLGDVAFFAGKFEPSVRAYDRAIELAPRLGPQLWQRGLALYYAGRYAEGVAQFESHQTVNSQDVENAVWHLACATRLHGLEQARQKLIRIQRDRRIPMAEVFEMFAGRLEPADVLQAAARTGPGWPSGSPAHRLQQYYGQLYIGLFHDMQGQEAEGRQAMQRAAEICPLPPGNFMGEVARVHLQARREKTEAEPRADRDRIDNTPDSN